MARPKTGDKNSLAISHFVQELKYLSYLLPFRHINRELDVKEEQSGLERVPIGNAGTPSCSFTHYITVLPPTLIFF